MPTGGRLSEYVIHRIGSGGLCPLNQCLPKTNILDFAGLNSVTRDVIDSIRRPDKFVNLHSATLDEQSAQDPAPAQLRSGRILIITRLRCTPRIAGVKSLAAHEETLHHEAGPVPGVHSLLRQNPRMRTCGSRHAAVLPSLPTLCSPDDLNAGRSDER